MRYFVFDTETTSLTRPSLQPIGKQPHIVEFYGCVWDSDKREVVSEVEFLAKPPVACEPDAEKAHHITAEMLKDAKPFKAYVDMVASAIEGANAVVAHNLSYDYNVTEYEMKRNGRTLQWPIRRICTVENTEWIFGYRLSLGPKKDKMGLYHYLFGETFADAHRAKPDTLALLRCFIELLDRGML